MARVEFKYANGRVRTMDSRHAKVLEKLGKGSYLTRDMRAAPVDQIAPVDVYANLTDDQLRDLAKAQGRKVHWNAGREKILEALEK
jgi:hypothetical protein